MNQPQVCAYGKLLNQLAAHAVTDLEHVIYHLDGSSSVNLQDSIIRTLGALISPYRQATALLAQGSHKNKYRLTQAILSTYAKM